MRIDPSASVGAENFPIDTPCTAEPDTCSLSEGARNATRNISTDNAGVSVPLTLDTSGMRRMTPFAGSPTDINPCPTAARSSSSMLGNTPPNRVRLAGRLVSSAPRVRSKTGKGAARSVFPVGSVDPVKPSTTGPAPMAAANSVSFDGRPARRAASTGSILPARCSRCCGDIRSASDIWISTPMASGRNCSMSRINSASSVRGHGHWPRAARLFSSMATTMAGVVSTLRGAAIWYASNPRSCRRELHEGSNPTTAASAPSSSNPTVQMRPVASESEPGSPLPLTTRFPSRRRRR